ncbi:MAG: undecaprenyldiphospho-muramoylpentapeptide beta-N-acetylglucosaminyltransferase [Bacteroidetes bacterium]|nr:undecaprenyldiphospho-muramoylpentapeptide beta-N-acetylglucosaminyltransferase [Bacteroidota bacterium]
MIRKILPSYQWRKELHLPHRFIVSGGGTGGHIFPAIAIANALKAKLPDAEFLFVGAEGKMEMEKVPAAGYKIEGLWISGLQRKLTWSNLSFPFKVINSISRAKKILKKFQPDAVIGTGGYASGPMLRVASKAGIPTLIQEQNSFPGITNKILANRVSRICVAYEGMEKFFPKEKIVFTGNPVRQDILNLEGKRPRGQEMFGLDANKTTLLVVGGSLGAKAINESLELNLGKLAEKNIQVVWQTGKPFFSRAEVAVAPFKGKGIIATEFITKMDYGYAAADIVISRAGAGAVSELCLVHKPCILVPLPSAAEDHQTKNAMSLVNHQAAILVKDVDAKNALVEKAIELAFDQELRNKMELNMSNLAIKNSADLIANEVITLINKKNSVKK